MDGRRDVSLFDESSNLLSVHYSLGFSLQGKGQKSSSLYSSTGYVLIKYGGWGNICFAMHFFPKIVSGVKMGSQHFRGNGGLNPFPAPLPPTEQEVTNLLERPWLSSLGALAKHL